MLYRGYGVSWFNISVKNLETTPPIAKSRIASLAAIVLSSCHSMHK
ncbi:hypothetical protein BIW11_03890 [Tropilaelaps mercedesae]|uniref:Uncharacterized protein n=1 Tax=Tropilaelaps mercedesae TaxID=418985 RepID=A0A1V9XE73_9ACAR|nr:hypothetical protein BIW11_03890 [Tropilaelaps mercedesae]